MASGTPIISIETQHPDTGEAPAPLPFADSFADMAQEAVAPAAPRPRWIVPALASLAAAGWTGFFAATQGAAIMASAPMAGGWVAQWSAPMVLVGVVYLIATRSSRAEAGRFADAAATLRREAEALETRLASVNRELSLAREFLGAQSRDLDSLGRVAVERISEHSGRLEALVLTNAAQVESIGSVSVAAVQNMEQLRDQLPVITTAAKDVASNIGNVGRVAHGHVQDMVSGLGRLTDLSAASERQVASLRERIEAALNLLEGRTRLLDQSISGRFDALEERSHGFAMDLERHEADARDALRQRSSAMAEDIAASRARLDREEAEALTSLRARLVALRDEAGTVARSLREGENGALATWQGSVARLAEDLAHFDAQVAERHAAAIAHASQLGSATEATSIRLAQAEARIEAITIADSAVASGMDARLDALERRLSDTDRALEKLTDSSVRLLELIQASAQHSREQLPAALAASEQQLATHETRVQALRGAVEAARDTGADLAQRVEAAQQTVLATTSALDTLHDGMDRRLARQGEAISTLRARLEDLAREVDRLGTQAGGEVSTALVRLGDAVRQALGAIESEGAAHVSALADQLSSESGAALERAMRLKASEITGQLEQAAAHALGVSREAAHQLRDQIAEVDTMAAALEARVADAREAAQDKIDSDFSRRMAIITDTLSSGAVDITRAISTEVADTAWAAYLRGDRGIFTRRAVKLLDAGDARQTLHLYETDSAFQAHVNRYIHDFEAMLRRLLATRDGHAVSVTLLSSDMGKLYVALAQAIERLRG